MHSKSIWFNIYRKDLSFHPLPPPYDTIRHYPTVG